MKDYLIKMEQTKKYICEHVNEIPEIAIILGSGLGSLADDITDKTILEYKDIPNFPISTVPGHKGELIFGKLEGVPVIAMNGRFHYYEGYDLKQTTYPIRVFSLLGVKTLILTNAAGTLARNQLWVFIVGPLIGGVLAALFYKFVIVEKEVKSKRK